MKIRYFAALFFSLSTFAAAADDASSVDAESLWITSIAPAGEGQFVVGTATGLLLRPGSVARVNGDDVNKLETLYEHPAAVWTVDVTSDGKTIASADYRGNLVTYDVASKQATTHESAFERWSQSVVIAPDDQALVAGNEAGKLFKWSLAESKVEKAVELGGASITGIAFSPDGKHVAATDGSGKIHLLSWPALDKAGELTLSDETAWCVAFTGDSKSLIAGSADRNLYQVAATADAKPEVLAKGTDWITRIAVSESGDVAASEVSGKIHFASGGSVTTLGAESGVWALCFSNSGRLLVGTRKNGIVTAGRTWTFTAPETQPESEAAPAEEPEAAEEASEGDAESDEGAEKESE